MGHHDGIHHYTIGQRRGLGIAHEKPLYVINIDAPKNRVVVGPQEELLSREFIAAGVNWIAFDRPAGEVRAEVRVRYRHAPEPASSHPGRPRCSIVAMKWLAAAG
jgi:tRNA-specific 2-thiouridylase